MAMIHRIRRLELATATLPSGHRRCRVCKDGTQPTGVIINLLGQQQNPTPGPCPGCGRDAPIVINYRRAEEMPARALAPQAAIP